MVPILLCSAFSACGDAKDGDKETTPSVNVENEPEVPENNAVGENDGENENNSENNNENEHDFTRVFTLDSLEPLSAEKQAEVEAAWTVFKNGKKLLWCDRITKENIQGINRYYGIYNEKVLIFHGEVGLADWAEDMVLAGEEIAFNYRFTLWIYNEGTFYELTEENQYEWFTEPELLKIVEYHREFEKYRKEIRNSEK